MAEESVNTSVISSEVTNNIYKVPQSSVSEVPVSNSLGAVSAVSDTTWCCIFTEILKVFFKNKTKEPLVQVAA